MQKNLFYRPTYLFFSNRYRKQSINFFWPYQIAQAFKALLSRHIMMLALPGNEHSDRECIHASSLNTRLQIDGACF